LRQDDLTPMYRQWAAAKRDYPDVLLLFRMGDFYEMFDEDARIGSEALGLTLTARKYSGDNRIPMCGVPHHALDRYLRQLVEKGFRAAICEQVEDPREAKGLVRRKVTRVITPGTLMEDELLQGQEHNFLLSLAIVGESAGVAVVDVSTGDFLVTELPCRPREHSAGTPVAELLPDRPAADSRYAAVADEIARLQPAEMLIPEELADERWVSEAVARGGSASLTPVPTEDLEFRSPAQQLSEFFGVESLRGFGCEDLPAAQSAAAQALRYLQRNRMDALPHLTGLATYSTEQFMVVDAATRRNLELVRTLRENSREGSLLALLDRTLTPMGARLLRQWLLQPLLDVDRIRRRSDAVEALVRDGVMADALRQALRGVRDLERLINRTTAGTANARDLSALGVSLAALPAVREALVPGVAAASSLLEELREALDTLEDLATLIAGAIAEEPPIAVTEGGLLRDGYSSELDELRDAMAHGREWIAGLQSQERARTGIESLKIGFNKVFGYYIEVSRANLHLVPPDYQRKQTLVNAERFITPDLKEMEEKILGAEEKAQDLEYELFTALRREVAQQADRVLATARTVARLDALLSLARVAVEYDYVKPTVDETAVLDIDDGRHPVVERALVNEAFVPNDVLMDCEHRQLMVVTGPNMAGKSTYLRQAALICLLAQIGSFVPAREARIGVVDRIFTRVGASDDLATGQSTFMVEMTETANILHNATDRSLIVLDEIGRGTSTFDGLSIAWAVAEYLVRKIGAKTLFATHYHHLNELTEVLPRVINARIAVKEQGEDIVFLRKIVAGGTDRSYGIQVARLAGLPQEVIERAREVLRSLEQEDLGRTVGPSQEAAHKVAPTVQLKLFEAAPDPVVAELLKLDLDTLAPVEALMRLKELQDEARKRSG
jgi:DNA mismatch repair protein MutS